jgi:uncharacterized protein YndB with AHSA1/START domain
MKTWLVSYADDSFTLSQERLMASALRYGIDEFRPWNRSSLEQTAFYKQHKSTLDQPRGGGYWLWKPFIIKETLKEMNIGDVAIYSDAGIEIIGDLSPLLDLCLQKDILLFAGHYDDVGAPGPNVCGKWTKRDCFLLMGCDESGYYQSQMLDASFLVITKSEKSDAFIREWFIYCCQPRLLTDQPDRCQHSNLPGFIEHRHDQSILSLLAARDGIEIFRHPSQYGNHLKDEPYRRPGEWKRYAYGAKGIYYNSPYKTLLSHHRGNLGRENLPPLSLRRTIPAPRRKVFYTWTEAEELKKWLSPAGYPVITSVVDLRVGGKYRLTMKDLENERSFSLAGEYIEIAAPARLVYSWPGPTRVKVEFHDHGTSTELVLSHDSFSNERSRFRHFTGWDASLDRLAEAISVS